MFGCCSRRTPRETGESSYRFLSRRISDVFRLEQYRRTDTLWGNTQRELLTWALNGIGIIHHEDLPKCGMAAQMALTGLVIMADWIASNTVFFPMIREDELPRKYDPKRAEFALQKLNLPAHGRCLTTGKCPTFL